MQTETLALNKQETFRLADKTVTELFKKLEDAGIPYAILGNYERFPYFERDVDIAISLSEIEKLKDVLIYVTSELGWDLLLSAHINDTKDASDTINFVFYNYDPFLIFQMDVAYCYDFCKLPVLTTSNLLNDRYKHKFIKFSYLNPLKENFIYLLKIRRHVARIISSSFKTAYTESLKKYCYKKIRYYRKKIVNFCELSSNEKKLKQLLGKKLGIFGVLALNSLKGSNLYTFYFFMLFATAYFLVINFFKTPFKTLLAVKHEINLAVNKHSAYVPKHVMKICAKKENKKILMLNFLEDLLKRDYIIAWSVKQNSKTTMLTEAIISAANGRVIEWIDIPSEEAFDISNINSKDEIARKILPFLFPCHGRIYEKTYQ
ncbi:MAG: hypothetical protein HYY52_03145 [Candidatus Melainabacteria bacterium]|nr:hypothetical protein [Candidatus Melainabacteria bacterium]